MARRAQASWHEKSNKYKDIGTKVVPVIFTTDYRLHPKSAKELERLGFVNLPKFYTFACLTMARWWTMANKALRGKADPAYELQMLENELAA